MATAIAEQERSKYQWRALNNESGEIINGTARAVSEEEVRRKLFTDKLTPISIRDIGVDASGTSALAKAFEKKIPTTDRAMFFRQLADMVSSGQPLDSALNSLAEETENQKLLDIEKILVRDYSSGMKFSAALAQHPKVFGMSIISMVRAGEENNRIGATLLNVAEDLEREDELTSKVKSALVYPMTILGLALVVSFVLLVTIVPTFKDFYASIGDGMELPFITQVLIWMSGVAPFALIGVVLLTVPSVLWFQKHKNDPEVREKIDHYKLKIPVIGKLLHLVALSRFTKSMASLVESGVLIPRALEISAEVTNHYQMSQLIRLAQASMEDGESIDKPLRGNVLFPPSLVNMMKTGQESGSMVNNMKSRATFYEGQINRMTKNLTELLEPMMMVVIGCLVGFIVMGVMAPYLNMGQLLNGTV